MLLVMLITIVTNRTCSSLNIYIALLNIAKGDKNEEKKKKKKLKKRKRSIKFSPSKNRTHLEADKQLQQHKKK